MNKPTVAERKMPVKMNFAKNVMKEESSRLIVSTELIAKLNAAAVNRVRLAKHASE